MADVIPNEGLMNLLQAAIGGDDPVAVRLAKNNPTLSPATVLADLVECDFSGYAAANPVAFGAPEVLPGGKVSMQSADAAFSHNGGPVSNTVRVYYVTLQTLSGPKLLWAGPIENAPKTMANVTDTLDLTLELRSTQEV